MQTCYKSIKGMNHRPTLRCGEENNNYRHDELDIFTGKINPQEGN